MPAGTRIELVLSATIWSSVSTCTPLTTQVTLLFNALPEGITCIVKFAFLDEALPPLGLYVLHTSIFVIAYVLLDGTVIASNCVSVS